MAVSGESVAVAFTEPHPLGLPAHRYSHPVQLLGKGAFGQVWLCCLRTEIGTLPPGLPSEPSGQMSVDADPNGDQRAGDGASVNGHGANGAGQPVYDYQWVAVKLYKPLVMCDLRSLEYLKREVVNQRKLEHQHVIGFREVGLTAELPPAPGRDGRMRLYLTLEYANGGTLKQWLASRAGRLPEDEARWFLQQLVYGLCYVHAQGIWNRDIKPDNLLLVSGQPLPLLKVSDFGLCKSSTDSVCDSRVGSPNYMAPEVIERPVSGYDGRKADVFSCGVVLYEMVFGALPFSRTLDGRPLNFQRNPRDILANMRAELWPQLLPVHRPPQDAAGASNGVGPAGAPVGALGAGGHPPGAVPLGASAGLMELLGGMLKYDPDHRWDLDQVKRHPWYRTGLTDEVYRLLLATDPPPQVPAGAPGQGHAQSVEVIEAEFGRIMAHCAALRQAAERAAQDAEFEFEG
ncbi:hypothetical protein HYH03_002615 [Edaphochlamys debaryana]|uniref:Protein kinase domain-containing protein n=1 Tax=Edaphochlamys debaryana TaxID=47281 RepID=A0A835YB23_9CHLO|nr:hypothetical protein HYH03_002615 [Edaphochlamys debaryana]|eukprot:KAG2499680.1 hypothetical protein HYH03_002615 [Edaphochlamys debaryana]